MGHPLARTTLRPGRRQRHEQGGPGVRRAGTFSSLRVRNYRLFFTGQLISVAGTWMQTVAQSFLVLGLTHSGTVLGLTIAVRFGPMFVLAPWAGVVVDRFDKQRLLYATQAISAAISCTFGLLITFGLMRLWLVYVLGATLGAVNALDKPGRQALLPELVPRDLVRNAVSLNSISQNLARIAGSGFGGVIVSSLGLSACFQLNALSFAAVIVSLAMMTGVHPAPPQPRARGQVRDGLRYAATTPQLALPLLMIAVIGALAWEFPISLPLLAAQVFRGGAETYGLMTAFMGVGAVIGALVTASRSRLTLAGLSVAAVGWGAAITAAALAPSLIVEYLLLIVVGYGGVTFNSLAKTSLQLSTRPAMRGRVMSLWALAWQGSTPIGGPLVGFVCQQWTPRWGLLIGGIPTVLIGVAMWPWLRRLDRRGAGQEVEEDIDPLDE
jgi:MFS family permease